jgi:hypothetical protein
LRQDSAGDVPELIQAAVGASAEDGPGQASGALLFDAEFLKKMIEVLDRPLSNERRDKSMI